ncbi:hypothetical protein ACHAXS_007655 [Conticribra weissflogii]
MTNHRVFPNDQALQMQLVSYSRCFPRLLHFVLSVVDRLELSHIISWYVMFVTSIMLKCLTPCQAKAVNPSSMKVLTMIHSYDLSPCLNQNRSPDGTHFTISNTDDFMRHVAPRFFPSQSNYKSFYRQLNLWGFERVGKLRQKGCGWRHSNFVRDKPALAAKLQRQPFKTENVFVRKWQSETKSSAGGNRYNMINEKKPTKSIEDNIIKQYAPSSEVVDAVRGLIALKHCRPNNAEMTLSCRTA